MNFIYITLSIIIIFLLFILYRFLIGDKTPLVKDIYLPNGNPDIPLSKLKITDYSTYTIEFWICVNKLPELTANIPPYPGSGSNNYMGGNGNIFKTNTGDDRGISLDLYSNGNLTFFNGRVNWLDISNKSHFFYPSVSTNLPVQKWIYVTISIQNNSLIDLFINGKLIQSSLYRDKYSFTQDKNNVIQNSMQSPKPNDILVFGKELDANITKMYITPKATDTNTAWKNYLKGPGIKTNFNLGVSLTQNGKNTNTIKFL